MNGSKGRRILPLALAALTTTPMLGALTSTGAQAKAAAKAQTFRGAVEAVDHGPVQVTITVKSRKITGVTAAISPQDGRSYMLQNGAIPILKGETLRAQSARINGVSGATDTSDGYVASLQSAIKKAERARALK